MKKGIVPQETNSLPQKPKRLKKEFYEFVTVPASFDFNRIVSETLADSPYSIGILLTSKHAWNSVVVLFNSFLERFDVRDGVYVGMEPLSPNWGYPVLPYLHQDIDDPSRIWFGCIDGDVSQTGAVLYVGKEMIGKVIYELTKACECLELGFRRSERVRKPRDAFKVKVYPLVIK